MSFKKFISNKIIAGAIALFVSVFFLWIMSIVLGLTYVDGRLGAQFIPNAVRLPGIVYVMVWGLIFYPIYYFLRRFK